MRILKQSMALVALGSLFVVAPSAAQKAGTSPFKWYVGGHGGVTSFRTNAGGRELMPVAGGHILITAKRTGLLLSVDQGFGSDEPTQTLYEIRDPDDATVQSGVSELDVPGHSPVLGDPHGLPGPERQHSALRRPRCRHRRTPPGIRPGRSPTAASRAT